MEESLITYTACPCCDSGKLQPELSAIDHTVSRKEFKIWECCNCSLRFTQNVPDAKSINRYYQSDNYISHTNTDRGLINRLYHFVRKQTLANKRHLVLSAVKLGKGKLLDIGAGTGAFVQHMQLNGWLVTGLEPDEAARKRAVTVHQVQLLHAENLPALDENSFDAITLWHVLEHVHDLHDYLQHLKRIIKPEGRIFIAVPNYTSYDAIIYKSYWAAYDVPRHLYHFSPKAMKQLLQKHNLQLHAVRPMWYDSFYISLLSEKYKTGRVNTIKGFFIGGLSNLRAFFNKERCSSLIYIAGK